MVCLGDDPLGKAKGLERFHATRLDAVGLADLEPTPPTFHNAGGDVRELGELGGGQHASRARTDDENIHLIRELCGTVDAGPGYRLDARVAGYVSVVVELHRELLIAFGRLTH